MSKGSVGHPVRCGPACKYVKRKGGCQDGANCSNCHQCFWSKAHPDPKPQPKLSSGAPSGARTEDAMHQEAQSLANKLVTLLGGEEPFGSTIKPKESKAVTTELSVGTQGHPHSCEEPCKYIRRKGGCMHGEACLKCHACIWSESSSKEAENLSSGVGFSAVAEGMQGHVATPLPVISLDKLLGSPTSFFTNPTLGWLQPAELQQEKPFVPPPAAPPASNQNYPWTSSVGSTGHPKCCGPACKYAMKPRGCKDGRLCSHCHLCRWMRYGVRANYKQPIEITAWTSL